MSLPHYESSSILAKPAYGSTYWKVIFCFENGAFLRVMFLKHYAEEN